MPRVPPWTLAPCPPSQAELPEGPAVPGRRRAGPVPFPPTQAVGEGAREPGQGAGPVHRVDLGAAGGRRGGGHPSPSHWVPTPPLGAAGDRKGGPSVTSTRRASSWLVLGTREGLPGWREANALQPDRVGFRFGAGRKAHGAEARVCAQAPRALARTSLDAGAPISRAWGAREWPVFQRRPPPLALHLPKHPWSRPSPRVLLPGSGSGFRRKGERGTAKVGEQCSGGTVAPGVLPLDTGSTRHHPFAVGEVSQQPSGPSEGRAERAGGQAAWAAGPGPQLPAGPCLPPPPAGPAARAAASWGQSHPRHPAGPTATRATRGEVQR